MTVSEMQGAAPDGSLDLADAAIAALIAVVVAGIALGGLTPYHAWRDDFAGYLLQARAIGMGNIRGEMHLNAALLAASDVRGGPSAYPWGFPQLLWLVAGLAGGGLVSLKLIGVASLGAATALTFVVSRCFFTRPLSVVSASLIGLQPLLLRGTDYVESDLPFLAFYTATLLLMVRTHRAIESGGRAPAWESSAAAVLTACSVTVRSNGALLAVAFVAVTGYLWLSAGKWRRSIVVAAGLYCTILFVLLVPYLTWFPDGNVPVAIGLVQPHVRHVVSFFTRARDAAILIGEFVPFSLLSRQSSVAVAVAGGVLVVLMVLIIVGAWAKRRYSLTVVLASLFYLGLILFLPLNLQPRYLYPLLVPTAVFGLAGLQEVAAGLRYRIWGLRPSSRFEANAGRLFAAAVVLAMAAIGCREAWQQPSYALSGPYSPTTRGMVAFLARNVPQDARVSFFKPRALRLLTGLQAIVVGRPDHVDRAAYFVIDKRAEDGRWEGAWQLDPSFFKADTSRFEKVFENEQFDVYRRLAAIRH